MILWHTAIFIFSIKMNRREKKTPNSSRVCLCLSVALWELYTLRIFTNRFQFNFDGTASKKMKNFFLFIINVYLIRSRIEMSRYFDRLIVVANMTISNRLRWEKMRILHLFRFLAATHCMLSARSHRFFSCCLLPLKWLFSNIIWYLCNNYLCWVRLTPYCFIF